VAGLDLGHSRDRTAFAIVHRQDEEVRLDRMQVWTPTRGEPVDFGEVESFVRAAHERFRFRLRLDPWQGLDLAQRLRAAGIHAEEFHFSPASKQRLASTLLHQINTGRLRLYDAPGLREELLDLRVKQTTSGGWAFDHDARGHDDRAVALALALVAAIERPSNDAISISTVAAPGPPVVEGRGLTRTGEKYLDLGADGELHPPPGWETASLHLPR
jgi:phage terminase large subunit-like protein